MDDNLPVHSKKEFKALQGNVEKFKKGKEDAEKQRGQLERKASLEGKTTEVKVLEAAKASLLANATEIANDLANDARAALLKSIKDVHPKWDLSAFEPVEEEEEEDEEEANSPSDVDVVAYATIIRSSDEGWTLLRVRSKAIAEEVFGEDVTAGAGDGDLPSVASAGNDKAPSTTDAWNDVHGKSSGAPDAS
ncbi:hypothetical protein CCACVL1_19235 [Corchorus capsularis]|uniref:Uncharacterized protein n=1 Tax=Corchorus capsularis TaxID=210143 RepID=A0A1R3HHR3_COCAP|nr:hypothetical protein CCACVL1_19235 [Corchorus capsularis]